MPWQVGRLIQGLAKVKAGLAEEQGNPGKSEETMVHRVRADYLIRGCVNVIAYLRVGLD